ncbi:hypothetical protein IW140_002354 [Coemansia sp. RSA 1813]|nr:hypothetical protein EV178_002017 [Coemansia sp. RSA 1646]KAJ1771827.1 hypothetical protein LPJ74_002001 [Coemansia sp. RSA 1843]KAJ2090791.1 hypothetical protein IW138_002409 [Coemansia sp. RSA 986]KAJ2216039.1 hypothetical protein EV179_001690 [Coemansia sp. RSA 487]KAJ2570454.1 hypothetical protein IW140_002354 [Coemansia sp. RSA 1813]
MAFETTVQLSPQHTNPTRDENNKAITRVNGNFSNRPTRVVNVRVEHNGEVDNSHKQMEAACIAFTEAPKKIDVVRGTCANSFCVIEHAGDALSVIRFDGNGLDGGQVVWAPTLPGDMLRTWWIDHGLLGIVSSRTATALGTRVLVLCVLDVCADNAIVAEHELGELVVMDSALGWAEAMVIARGTHIACVAAPDVGASGGVLRSWTISPEARHRGAQKAQRMVRVTESPTRTIGGRVLDLRWIDCEEGSIGLGICAQPEHTFWFAVGKNQCTVYPHDMSRILPPVMPSWRWHAAVVAAGSPSMASGVVGLRLPPERPVLCLPGPTGTVFYSLDAHATSATAAAAAVGPVAVHKTRFPRGWVWLCGTPKVCVILSPCRQMAAVCRMPLGERLFTVRTTGAVIQDAWIATSADVCAVSAGDMLHLVDYSCLLTV